MNHFYLIRFTFFSALENMDPAVKRLFEKSSDPAHRCVLRLDAIVSEILDEPPLDPSGLDAFARELDSVGEQLSRRDMLHDALQAVSLKDRRKRAGVHVRSVRFAPFKRLTSHVRHEVATSHALSEDDRAVEQGLCILGREGKTVLPGLQRHLDVYGLRAGKMYREGTRRAWIPFSWKESKRKENKVVALKIDHVAGTHEVFECHPAFIKKFETENEDEGITALVESTTEHLIENLGRYRPISAQDKFRKILRAFYKTDAAVTDHGLRVSGSVVTEDLLFVGFFVSTNKGSKISHAYFRRKRGGDVLAYENTHQVSEMLLRKATELLEHERPTKKLKVVATEEIDSQTVR